MINKFQYISKQKKEELMVPSNKILAPRKSEAQNNIPKPGLKIGKLNRESDIKTRRVNRQESKRGMLKISARESPSKRDEAETPVRTPDSFMERQSSNNQKDTRRKNDGLLDTIDVLIKSEDADNEIIK